MILLLAGTFAQAELYAREYGIGPRDFIYVDGIDQVLGRDGYTLICCGTYSRRKDFAKIMEHVSARRGVKIIYR